MRSEVQVLLDPPFTCWQVGGVRESALRAKRVRDPVGQLAPFGALAQLGERLICIQEVIGSIPIGSTRMGR